MKEGFDYRTLAALYDRGCLVPFIGSGMSRPICASWKQFVQQLEHEIGIDDVLPEGGSDTNLTQRALIALQRLRRKGVDVAAAVRTAVYVADSDLVPRQSIALASVFWPLVCSTNYDDVYLRATLQTRSILPRVLGRSETDCRRVMQHLNLPAGEVLWVIQGFLAPASERVKNALGTGVDARRLEPELVVGHAEYRRASHRTPHFRRCFAELFRTRSLLFLGSGLEETYLRALFDEIIELSGPPIRPHFAIVEEGKLDPGFMREQYHIVCNTYGQGDHEKLFEILREFSGLVLGTRTRPHGWKYIVNSPVHVREDQSYPCFEVTRAPLPRSSHVAADEAVAASCGREADPANRSAIRGIPMLGDQARKIAGMDGRNEFEWLNDWTIKFTQKERSYGIVARDLVDTRESSRDRRSPEAIRRAFGAFLDVAEGEGLRVAHVQLLGAGKLRVFQPWVSLVQMARAYGQWVRDPNRTLPVRPSRLIIYVVDPGVIALLSGGHIDLAEQLEDAPLRIRVEIIDAFGQAEDHHVIVDPVARLEDLSVFAASATVPKLSAHPVPTRKFEAMPLNEARGMAFKDFGLVSGSTLVIDYRA